MRNLRIPSPCRAAAAAFLSARVSFQGAISKDDDLSVGSDLETAHHFQELAALAIQREGL
jgi:hypothetical protein